MKSLKYISAQPDELYFAWQVEVMLDNFLSHHIPAGDIHIIVGIDKTPSEWWHKLIERFPGVGFYFYKDERLHKQYAPSIQPHILAKHFERFPELSKDAIFYHDCDMLFTRDPRFENLLEDDIWYVSDTRSDYLSSQYILSKGDHVLKGMCSFAGHESINDNRSRSSCRRSSVYHEERHACLLEDLRDTTPRIYISTFLRLILISRSGRLVCGLSCGPPGSSDMTRECIQISGSPGRPIRGLSGTSILFIIMLEPWKSIVINFS